MMNSDKWAVYIHSQQNGFCGVVYFPVRRMARTFVSRMWGYPGYTASVRRTGL